MCRELGLCSLEKRSLWGDLIAASQHPMELIGKIERGYLEQPGVTGQEGVASNRKRVGLD